MYILPCTKSLIEDNQINGYLLDTTFRIMPYFDTSIIMASIYNTGLALGFSFTRTEESQSFNLLFDNLNSKCGINFEKKAIETDQETALCSTIKLHQMVHLKCLRHFLKNLQPNPYSFHLKQLIECCTEFEFNNTLKELTNIFKRAILFEESQFQKGKRPTVSVKIYINDILNKVGLMYNYQNNSIDFKEKEKWDKISMLNRIKYRMPSTTNSLESYHGHLNKVTSRRNTFFGSIFRIASNLNKHNKNYQKRIRHNFNRAIQNTKQESNRIDPIRLNKEKIFYEIDKEHCKCSSNKLISSQLGFNIPCMHQLSIMNSSEIPQLPDFHIT